MLYQVKQTTTPGSLQARQVLLAQAQEARSSAAFWKWRAGRALRMGESAHLFELWAEEAGRKAQAFEVAAAALA